MYMMFILCLAADAVPSGNWFTVFKVLTLNVAKLTMFLHLNNFGLGLSSVADFFELWDQSANLSRSLLLK